MDFSVVKKIVIAKIILLAIATLPLMAKANCPSIENVTFTCTTIAGKQHCQWSAPWWEGYHGDAQTGEHPAAFVLAFWGASSNPDMGSINCFYRDYQGNFIELSQNNWGGIPKHSVETWIDGVWPMPDAPLPGKICRESITDCKFPYG